MSTIAWLDAVCDPDRYSNVASNPWFLSDGRIVATDGKLLICLSEGIPEGIEYTKASESHEKMIGGVLARINGDDARKIGTAAISEVIRWCGKHEPDKMGECQECYGSGSYTCSECGNCNAECRYCEGEGKGLIYAEQRPGKVKGVSDAIDLNRLAKAVPHLHGRECLVKYIPESKSFYSAPSVGLCGDGWLVILVCLAEQKSDSSIETLEVDGC